MKKITEMSVLVVEDAALMRSLIVKTLKKNDIGNVTQASNGKQALDAVTRFQKKMAGTYNQAWMNFFS